MAKTVMDFLAKAREIVEKKGQDYDGGIRCRNFFQAAKLASLLLDKPVSPKDVIAGLLGVKIARLSNLTCAEGEINPNFESVEDTVIDIMNYFGFFEEIRQMMMEIPDETSPSGVD